MMSSRIVHIDPGIEKDVLYVLQYYALFDYPLDAEEIYHNCPQLCSLAHVSATLQELEHNKSIYRYKNFYSVNPAIEAAVSKRLAGNELAAIRQVQAKQVGNFIYKFPFVRFVGISGALSKGYATPESDFDFFIITSHNRLWICRTLLHLFKKLTFLVGAQERYCMNYFLDAAYPAIEEKNRFTAIELRTLIPVRGFESYKALMDANSWTASYLPNNLQPVKTGKDKTVLLKRIIESLFNMLLPSRLNKLLMKLTDAKWRRKWKKKNYPDEDYNLAFKTTLYVSKNHPANYQKKILQQLDKKYF